MDCRWTRFFAAIALACTVGCDAKTFPLWPSGPNDAAGPVPPADANTTKFAAVDLSFPEVKELKPATLVAFASLKEKAATDSPAEREANLDRAQSAYQQALKMDPKYVPAHLGLAWLLECRGDHKGALASYREVLKLAPDDPRNWLEVGMCHARHKEWKEAIAHMRKAQQLNPTNSKCNKALGLCLARSGDPDEALLYLMKAEGEAQAHLTVARMMHHLKRDDVSKKYARQALVADPKLVAARQLLVELEGGEAPVNLGVSAFESEGK